MNQKHIHIFILLTVLIGLASCNDILDTVPYSNTVVENFYKTPEDAELALTGCYNAIVASTIQGNAARMSFNGGMQMMLDAGTDECLMRDGFSNPIYGTIGNATYTAQDDIFKHNWAFLFAGVSRANYLLDRLDGIEMDSLYRVRMKAEARFLRGFFYMYLGMFYGGVPVYVNSNQDPLAARNSIKDVFTLVINDFNYAYTVLPIRSTKEGRANKFSAAGLLTKTYCYLASCKTNNVGADFNFELNSFNWVDATYYYTRARGISDDIIKNSGYKLTSKYDYLFRETTYKEQYEECLFTAESTPLQAQGTDYGAWLYYLIPVGNNLLYGGGFGWFRPTGEMYYDLYMETDLRRTQNLTGPISTTTENIDGVTYYVPVKGTTPVGTTYGIGKFRYRDPKTKNIVLSLSEGNYPILRYADILLLNAEAKYFTGDEELARERVSDVRRRISAEIVVGAPTLASINNQYYRSDFVTELLEERSRELCFEGQRRIDLLRFNKLTTAINNLSDGNTAGRLMYWNSIVPILKENWNSGLYKIWFPIPINDILLNKNLIQNPGYETRAN